MTISIQYSKYRESFFSLVLFDFIQTLAPRFELRVIYIFMRAMKLYNDKSPPFAAGLG
jgi:hypothetical protein